LRYLSPEVAAPISHADCTLDCVEPIRRSFCASVNLITLLQADLPDGQRREFFLALGDCEYVQLACVLAVRELF
jgi:hypothetical protein